MIKGAFLSKNRPPCVSSSNNARRTWRLLPGLDTNEASPGALAPSREPARRRVVKLRPPPRGLPMAAGLCFARRPCARPVCCVAPRAGRGERALRSSFGERHHYYFSRVFFLLFSNHAKRACALSLRSWRTMISFQFAVCTSVRLAISISSRARALSLLSDACHLSRSAHDNAHRGCGTRGNTQRLRATPRVFI